MNRIIQKILIILIAVFVTTVAFADSVQTKNIFDEANELYRQNEYHRAIKVYDSLINSGIESANLYYNTANTNYKLENYTSAILYYEKALLYGGNQREIAYNLELAKLNITDKIEVVPDFFLVRIWKSTLFLFSSKKWSIISIFLFVLVLIFVVFIVVFQSVFLKKILIPVFSILLLVFIITTLFSIQKSSMERNSGYAIIFEPTVYVKSAPDDKSTDLFLIHEGLKVDLIEHVGEWTKMELADGKVGWIPNDTYEKI